MIILRNSLFDIIKDDRCVFVPGTLHQYSAIHDKPQLKRPFNDNQMNLNCNEKGNLYVW